MTLYFITGNINKFKEVKDLLGNDLNDDLVQLDIDLPEIQEVNPEKIILAKLNEAIKQKSNESCVSFIVEDTSLYFSCLKNLPGPLIKWFLKELGREGLYDLVEKYGDFSATASTIIGYYSKKKVVFFRGDTKGKIVFPLGDSNFGWDPIFMPKGLDKTYAQMSKKEKNLVSHRMKAVNKLKDFLLEVK